MIEQVIAPRLQGGVNLLPQYTNPSLY
jgi:hypothetical protein